MLTDGVAVVNSLLHAMIVASVPLNTRKLSALGNVPRLRRCGGMADTADSKSAASSVWVQIPPSAPNSLVYKGRVRHHAARRVHPWPRKELHERRLQHGEGRLKSNRGTRTENLLHVGVSGKPDPVPCRCSQVVWHVTFNHSIGGSIPPTCTII